MQTSKLFAEAETTVLDKKLNFDELVSLFRTMLSSHLLRCKSGWFDRARLWRMIFLANENGSFAPTNDLAIALLASHITDRANVVKPARPWRAKVSSQLHLESWEGLRSGGSFSFSDSGIFARAMSRPKVRCARHVAGVL